MTNYGFLAIWCDISREDLDDYRNWLMREHIADRTFSPGFLGVRLFEALDDPKSHFILYSTADQGVLDGAAYKKILDNPSDWTRRIMPKFGPFDRALGTQSLKVGNGYGPTVAVFRIKLKRPDVNLEDIEKRLAAYCGQAGVVSIRVCSLSRKITDRISEEKTMRRDGEGDFDFLLCAETMNDESARQVEARLSASLPQIFSDVASFESSCHRMIYAEAPHEGPSSREVTAR